jgi:hypothetical protein
MSSIYFRPTSAQPYHIVRAAQWLTQLGKFADWQTGYSYLVELETRRPDLFRFYINEYVKATSFRVGYLVDTQCDDKSFRSATGAYGEEPHMYYSRR